MNDLLAQAQKLTAAGVYGLRITLKYVPDLADLPFPDMSANLIVSSDWVETGALPGNIAEVFHKLRPAGGKAYLGSPSPQLSKAQKTKLGQWIKAGSSGSRGRTWLKRAIRCQPEAMILFWHGD